MSNHETHEKHEMIKAERDSLFSRVVSILEQARTNVVRVVNSSMVMACWLIGREIVQELQGGEERAEYGKQVIENLSRQLTEKYGDGFSATSLKYFRSFYLAYPNRLAEIGRPMGDELPDLSKGRPMGAELMLPEKSHPPGDEFIQGFSSRLSWSHYRALMRVIKPEAREFYEREAIACGWDKRSLERHIQSQYFERLLKSQHPQKMLEAARKDSSLKVQDSKFKIQDSKLQSAFG